MTSLASLLQQYHSELLAPLCHFLDACDLAQLTLCNSSFHRLLQQDILVWKQSFLHKWGQSRALNAAQHHNLLWRDAFAQLETLKRAALQGRWFEYEGAWVGISGYEFHFTLTLHCCQKLIAPTPCPPIPPELQQKSTDVLESEARLKALYRQQVPPNNRPRILKEDVEWLPYPESLLHWCLDDDGPLQNRNERYVSRGVEYYPNGLLVSDMFTDVDFYEQILDDDFSWLPTVPADVLYRLRHHHVHSHIQPQTGFVNRWDGDADNRAVTDGKHDVTDGKHDVTDGKHDVTDGKHDVTDGKHDVTDGKHDVGDGDDKNGDDCYVPVQGIIEWTMTKV